MMSAWGVAAEPLLVSKGPDQNHGQEPTGTLTRLNEEVKPTQLRPGKQPTGRSSIRDKDRGRGSSVTTKCSCRSRASRGSEEKKQSTKCAQQKKTVPREAGHWKLPPATSGGSWGTRRVTAPLGGRKKKELMT